MTTASPSVKLTYEDYLDLPEDGKRHEITKRRLYERHGVAEYWVVDPLVESIKVYRRTAEGRYERAAELTLEAGDTLRTPLLAGLQIPLQAVFE